MAHVPARTETWAYDPLVETDPARRADRVRWGPIWAGLTTAIGTFALLQLIFFATDAINLDVNPSPTVETTLPFWTGLAAVVAFILGGMVTGGSARWRGVWDGVLQGVVLWALTVLALLVGSGVAAGRLTSSLGGTLGRLAELREQLGDTGSLTDAQISDARDTAGAAVGLLMLMLAATLVGTLIGIKLWPRRRDHAVIASEAATTTGADASMHRETIRDERTPAAYDPRLGSDPVVTEPTGDRALGDRPLSDRPLGERG